MNGNILDGLAWAALTERARVARISAGLVRTLPEYQREHIKADVKKAVSLTRPPHGRGKYIIASVEDEYLRQLAIYKTRQKNRVSWKEWLAHQSKLSTRIDNAYAARFGRPTYEPYRVLPDRHTASWEERRKWDEEEAERDTGDECLGLTIQDGHTVCYIRQASRKCEVTLSHVAVRRKDGPIVRTIIRCADGIPNNLAEVVVCLGGPKVRSAILKGKRVVTDWVGRRTFIHHTGQDHIHPHVEELPWRSWRVVEPQIVVDILISGEREWIAPDAKCSALDED